MLTAFLLGRSQSCDSTRASQSFIEAQRISKKLEPKSIKKTLKKSPKETQTVETWKDFTYEFFIGLVFTFCLIMAAAILFGGIIILPFYIAFFNSIDILKTL